MDPPKDKTTMQQGWSQSVQTFTAESTGVACPNEPQPLSRERVQYIVGMVCSELVELAQTVCTTDAEAVAMVRDAATTDLKPHPRATDPDEVCADQADAAVDAAYYLCNEFAKHGINLDGVFKVVHDANLRKRDPTTGQYLRRPADGKVIKPPGWTAPNVVAEMRRQRTAGSWS